MRHHIYLKTAYVDLDLSEVLQSEPLVLSGVSDEANTLLASLKITTVFDLAYASVFANAARVVDAAERPESVLSRHGGTPSDVIDHAHQATPIDDLPTKPTSVLVGIGALEDQIAEHLDARTVRDLAFWPPYVAAKLLVQAAFTPEALPGFDVEAPPDLIPKSGELATQKILYSTTVLIESKPSITHEWQGGLIDLTALDRIGFSDVAFGAVMTFAQKWSPKAVALGQLLHSLPLAPGESTNLTVVDWTRRVSASTDENISQAERLSNAMNQSTAISEITSSVANEHQEGSSISGSASTSASAGAVGVPLIPIPSGPGVMPLPVLGTASGSMNVSGAATYTVSSGTRSVSANAMQNIASRTQQNASLSRSRRAAIVSEVSESERENITTRTVTNYNHMHALSIQYYEVVQVYEAEVKLSRIERCIFIPMRLVNFRSETTVRKYLPILIRHALDHEIRDRLFQFRDTIVMQFSFDRFAAADLQRLREDVDRLREDFDRVRLSFGTTPGTASEGEADADSLNPFSLPEYYEKRILLNNLEHQVSSARRAILTSNQSALRKRLLESFARNDMSAFNLDRSILLKNVAWDEDSGIVKVIITKKAGESIVLQATGDMTASPSGLHAKLAGSIPLDQIKAIRVTLDQNEANRPSEYGIFQFHLLLEHRGRQHWFDASFVASKGYTGELFVLQMHLPVDMEELGDRLMQDQLYYSQQIWLKADRQTLMMQLAPYEYQFEGGGPIRVVDYIDPVPVTVAGNYLAFRFTYDADDAWQIWRKDQVTKARPVVDLVPVPTGGVFAEAVLGQFNSAEKLDATRFWKWEDSPIPFKAGQIAETKAGQHLRIKASETGTLPTPVVEIQALPDLPALQATSALTAAVLSAEIFHDMSGHDITAKLLKASLDAAKSGNLAAQKQAELALKEIYTAVESLVKTFASNGTDIVSTLTGLGSAMNLIEGGGSGAAAGAAAGAAGTAAEGTSIATLASQLGPVIAKLAPMLLAL